MPVSLVPTRVECSRFPDGPCVHNTLCWSLFQSSSGFTSAARKLSTVPQHFPPLDWANRRTPLPAVTVPCACPGNNGESPNSLSLSSALFVSNHCPGSLRFTFASSTAPCSWNRGANALSCPLSLCLTSLTGFAVEYNGRRCSLTAEWDSLAGTHHSLSPVPPVRSIGAICSVDYSEQSCFERSFHNRFCGHMS